VAVDALDLSLPSRGAEAVRDPHGDQTGHQPVAVVLDQWVRDWQETRARREGLPVPTVPELVRWLRHRLEWACDEHPAVDEFAAEVRETLAALRGVLGLTRLRHRLPAPCPDCEMLTLVREDGGDYVECGACHRLWTEDEYARLAVVAAEEAA
jgi:Zn ribbon nucleic-acid-binding protein